MFVWVTVHAVYVCVCACGKETEVERSTSGALGDISQVQKGAPQLCRTPKPGNPGTFWSSSV